LPPQYKGLSLQGASLFCEKRRVKSHDASLLASHGFWRPLTIEAKHEMTMDERLSLISVVAAA